MTTSKTKTPAPTRTRVKELALARLEALTEKQARQFPKMKAPAVRRSESGNHKFANQQAERLTHQLCLLAIVRKRRSLKRALPMAFVHWRLEAIGETDPELPRIAGTDAAVHALGRADALLTRLVWRGAEQQARQEMEADASQ